MTDWDSGRVKWREDRTGTRRNGEESALAGAPMSQIGYSSSAASLAMMTFRCVVTSLCSLTAMVNSPMVLSASCS